MRLSIIVQRGLSAHFALNAHLGYATIAPREVDNETTTRTKSLNTARRPRRGQRRQEPNAACALHQHLANASRSAEVTIPRFDPSTGILGAFREVLESQRNTAILVDENPVLAVFPSTQRVWIAVDSDHLKSLCQQDKINLKLKHIPDENNVQDRANATVTSSMWQIALWTANGRLVNPLNPDTVFHLKSWPNLTRLAPLPEAMRLSAFLTKTSVNLNMLYKLLPLDMKDILNYIAATYLTDYLTVTQQTGSAAATQSATRATVDTSATPKPEQVRAARPSPAHAKQDEGGLLSRFMKKLLNR